MKKSICFYVLIFLISFCTFACIFPYPALSRYTNYTEKQMSLANRIHETEFTKTENTSNAILDISWNEGINILLETNRPYELFDFKTKQYFFIERIGGENHADVIPNSEEDFNFINENLSQTTDTPVVLIYNSSTVIPASFSAYMHGYPDSNNTFHGHYCLHFKSSKTTETGNVDYYHQKAIKSAFKQASKLIKE